MTADAEEKTQVDAEGTDVGSGLAVDPEDTEVPLLVELDELALVDGTHAQPPLHGGDQRGTLEQRTGQGLDGLGQLGLLVDGAVQADDGDVLLTGTLLGLDQAGSPLDAHKQATYKPRDGQEID